MPPAASGGPGAASRLRTPAREGRATAHLERAAWWNRTRLWAAALALGLVLGHSLEGAGATSRRMGAKLWQCELGLGAFGQFSPTVGPDGIVYAEGGSGGFCAVDAVTGAVLWSFKTNGWVVATPSVGLAGEVYVGCGALHSFRGAVGTVNWAFATGAGFNAIPALGGDGTVYGTCRNGGLYALDGATGEKRHEFMASDRFYVQAAIGGDGTVFCASGNGTVYAIDPVSWQKRWQAAAGTKAIWGLALGAENTVYLGSEDRNVYALNGQTGEQLWRFGTRTAVRASPAVGRDGTVYLMSDDGSLYALDGKSGDLKWRFVHGSAGFSSPALTENGLVWILGGDGYLYAVAAADGKVAYKSEGFPFSTGGPVPSPAIDDQGVAYVAAGAYLFAISCGAGPENSPWPMLGQNASHSGRLPSPAPPQIAAQPDNQTAVLGGGAVLKVRAAPGLGLTYRWRKDGVDLSADERIVGVDSCWLRIETVGAGDAGRYSVVVRNALGEVESAAATLEVVASKPGALRWQFATGGRVLCAPSLDTNGSLFCTSSDGHLYALDAFSGGERWRLDTVAGDGSTPVVGANGWVYGVMGYTGSVYAVEASSGAPQWMRKLPERFVQAPALAADGTLYLGTSEGRFYALDGQTGATRWQYQTATNFFCAPAIGLDGTIYLRQSDGTLLALDPVAGQPKWDRAVGGIGGSACALGADGTLFFGSADKSVYALDAATGAPRWQFTTGGYVRNSPVLGADGTVYSGGNDNRLYALEGATGQRRWEFAAGNWMSTAAVAADGTVYAGSFDGALYALDGTSGEPIWEFVAQDAFAAPVTLGPDGTVYAGSYDGRIYAVWGSSAPAVSPWPQYGHDALHTGRAQPTDTRPRFDRVTLSQRTLELGWMGRGMLQYADDPAGPWRDLDVGGGAQYRCDPQERQRFFRLVPAP